VFNFVSAICGVPHVYAARGLFFAGPATTYSPGS
jgi:hypothetical protein